MARVFGGFGLLGGFWLFARRASPTTLSVLVAVIGRAGAKLQSDRGALEAEDLAQLVLEVALEREVDQRRVVDEEDEGRRADLWLRHVVDTQWAPLHRGWVVPLERDTHRLVEFGGWHAQVAHVIDAPGVV